MALVTSRYTFTNATFPLAGSNGNPYGNCTAAAGVTTNSEGAVLAATSHTLTVTMASPTSVALTGGYYWEGRFKGGVANTNDRYIFSLYDSVAAVHRTLISRNTATGLGLIHQSGSASSNTFVLYDGSFHTYRIEYESGQVRRYRDGALITANQITTIAAPTDGNINRVDLAGSFGTGSADPGAPITLEYSEFGPLASYSARITWAEAQYQASGVPSVTDYSSPMSRGIFRGIERGVA